jgi:23S rRNA (guanosine2251-2'-O)-methyltransferase
MNPEQIIKGIRPLTEAIAAGREIDRVFVQKGLSGLLMKELQNLLTLHNIPFQLVPVEKLNRISGSKHQGIIAYVSSVIYSSLDHIITTSFQSGREPMVIVLDRITDVRNFGAIARTAEGLGFDAIVIPSKGSAQINPDAMKASAGALNHIPVCRENNLFSAIRYLKESGLQVYACTEKAEQDIYRQEFKGPIALLFGSEEDGISPAMLKLSDFRVKVPMKGKIASFNVSVTVAIVGGEVIRQKGL